MVLAPSVAGLFKWRQFEPEMILLAVGWYLRFSLSYRGVEELLAERGLLVDDVTVWRWVRVTPRKFSVEIARRGSDRPTTVGRVDSDLHPGQRRVALPLSGGGLLRCGNGLRRPSMCLYYYRTSTTSHTERCTPRACQLGRSSR